MELKLKKLSNFQKFEFKKLYKLLICKIFMLEVKLQNFTDFGRFWRFWRLLKKFWKLFVGSKFSSFLKFILRISGSKFQKPKNFETKKELKKCRISEESLNLVVLKIYFLNNLHPINNLNHKLKHQKTQISS